MFTVVNIHPLHQAPRLKKYITFCSSGVKHKTGAEARVLVRSKR